METNGVKRRFGRPTIVIIVVIIVISQTIFFFFLFIYQRYILYLTHVFPSFAVVGNRNGTALATKKEKRIPFTVISLQSTRRIICILLTL